MEVLNKAPRWFLLIIAGMFVVGIGLVGENVWADSQKTKAVAYESRGMANTATLQVAALSGQIQEIKNSNETFRREYREDQNRLSDTLREILRKT